MMDSQHEMPEERSILGDALAELGDALAELGTRAGSPAEDTSRRAAAGRAQLRALILGGAVWDAFRENANCGNPPG